MLDLEYRMQKHRKSLADNPGMPIPTNVSNPCEESRIIMDELDYNVNEQNDIVSQNFPLLNADQFSIYNIINATVNDTNSYSNAFFIDGPGWTGKRSFITRCYPRSVHRVILH